MVGKQHLHGPPACVMKFDRSRHDVANQPRDASTETIDLVAQLDGAGLIDDATGGIRNAK